MRCRSLSLVHLPSSHPCFNPLHPIYTHPAPPHPRPPVVEQWRLSDSAARKLLTYAFSAEIIERIPVASLKHQLQQRMLLQTGRQS